MGKIEQIQAEHGVQGDEHDRESEGSIRYVALRISKHEARHPCPASCESIAHAFEISNVKFGSCRDDAKDAVVCWDTQGLGEEAVQHRGAQRLLAFGSELHCCQKPTL